MLYDRLERRGQYEGLGEDLARGLRFLAETDLASLAEGRHEVDGDRVFALIQSYETRPTNNLPESHRAYLDIQYLFEGEELVGVAPLEEMTGIAEAHPERDLWLHHGAVEKLPLGGGRFMVLWPGDAHAPCIAVGGHCAKVRKCVVKVKV